MSVESTAYKPPEGYSTLACSDSFKNDVTRPHNLNDLPEVARELGFFRIADFPTKRSQWQVFDRPEHDVPNFPDGTTRISSTLAVYDTAGELTHAILRTSRQPYPVEEFTKDLAAFTKHYIERPRLLGFPSQELTRMRTVSIALAVGVVSMSAVDYYAIHSLQGSIVNAGSILGEIGGPAIYGTLWALSERRARRSISHPEQCVAGNSAKWTLEGERSHNVAVVIQKELYQVLQQEGANLTPDQFLKKIYGQIPAALIERRHAEAEQAKYPKLDSPKEIGNSLPKLVEVSHALQTVELYLQRANNLRQSLAQ